MSTRCTYVRKGGTIICSTCIEEILLILLNRTPNPCLYLALVSTQLIEGAVLA